MNLDDSEASVPLPWRVLKLGGSLLDLPDLHRRFTTWHATLPPAIDWLIVGGGLFADGLRDYQLPLELSDKACHELSLEAMSLSARLIQRAWGWPLRTDWPRRDATSGTEVASIEILDAGRLASFERELPASWALTSDSIAAWVAQRVAAGTLVLLKSREAPRGWRETPGDLVDTYFAEFAQGIPQVELVNLREERWA